MVSILMVLSTVFITPNQNADYKVFVTNNRYEADLWIWKTDSRYESKNKEEFWTETKSKFQSDFTIRFVRTKSQADFVIYFTNSKYQAGWKKNHKLKNTLNFR
jgi:hypothetical protein